LSENGFPVLNCNYRLLDDAPWPACGDDCLAAARFLLEQDLPGLPAPGQRRIAVVGASAGGHLALMTGLRLPPEKVCGIVDICGVTRLMDGPNTECAFLGGPAFLLKFFGRDNLPDAETMEAAEPHRYVTSASPPLLCIHSKNDHLVLPRQAGAIVATFLSNNVPAELYLFDGSGTSHGIWQRDDVPVDQRQFVAGPGQEMLKFLTSLASAEKKRV
jgi:acetyl esterase/lipase